MAVSSFATDLLVAEPARMLALPDAGEAQGDVQAALVATVARYAGRELLAARDRRRALATVADRVVREASRRPRTPTCRSR